jgi:hypothetical protein
MRILKCISINSIISIKSPFPKSSLIEPITFDPITKDIPLSAMDSLFLGPGKQEVSVEDQLATPSAAAEEGANRVDAGTVPPSVPDESWGMQGTASLCDQVRPADRAILCPKNKPFLNR